MNVSVLLCVPVRSASPAPIACLNVITGWSLETGAAYVLTTPRPCSGCGRANVALTSRPVLVVLGSATDSVASPAALPPIEGPADARPLTSESLLELERIPARLLVLGAGTVGVELGQAMQRLGSRVTLVGKARTCCRARNPTSPPTWPTSSPRRECRSTWAHACTGSLVADDLRDGVLAHPTMTEGLNQLFASWVS